MYIYTLHTIQLLTTLYYKLCWLYTSHLPKLSVEGRIERIDLKVYQGKLLYTLLFINTIHSSLPS